MPTLLHLDSSMRHEGSRSRALSAHFAQPGSLAFVTTVNALAAERPTITIYEASPFER